MQSSPVRSKHQKFSVRDKKKPLRARHSSDDLLGHRTGCVETRGFPRGPGVEGCGPKICKFICVSRRAIPHPAWLPGLPTCERCPRRPMGAAPLSLSASPVESLPYVTINETCLAYPRVTIGQSLRARRKGVIRRPIRAHTYAPSRGSHQLSSNSLCLRYPSSLPLLPRGVPEMPTVLRQDTGSGRASWSGTFRPVSSRALPLIV